jgi:hypothetical protein
MKECVMIGSVLRMPSVRVYMVRTAFSATFAFAAMLLPGLVSECAAQSSINLNVPAYNQSNPSWGKQLLGNSTTLTLASKGCAVTCYAMLASYDNRMTFTPDAANRLLRARRGFDSQAGLDFSVGASLLGKRLERRNFRTYQEARNVLYAYLRYGRPVITEVRRNGGQHFVIVTGYDPLIHDFRAIDPAGGRLIWLGSTYGRPVGIRGIY